MKKLHLLLATAVALFVTGCETDGGITKRTQEKSAVYAKLRLSEKRFIKKGVIAPGFTNDMVYMAMGKPTKIETADFPEGKRELWTYSRYYPYIDAAHGFRTASYNTEMHYQRDWTVAAPEAAGGETGRAYGEPGGRRMPGGMDHLNPSGAISGGSPPQGGSTQPADLQSYTFVILFQHGKVNRFEVTPNHN